MAGKSIFQFLLTLSVVEMDTKHGEVRLKKLGGSEPPKEFTFDSVYDCNSTQEEVYVNSAFPIVKNVLIGYNGTIFAYGQTGTGKTFTIEGLDSPPEMAGVMPRAFDTIFSNIQCDDPEKRQYLVRASYMELYKEDVRDLLSTSPKTKLELHEKPDSGVYVKDLTTTVVTSVQELKEIQLIGRRNRTTAETAMNDRSSRSHALFTITIETSEPGVDGKPKIRAGKLHMVDLAGSERQSKTGAVGERLEEATKINLSLSTLCHVISSLVDAKNSFIPYRNSKLTRLLQDSLGGNTKTVMIANIGPADYNYDESLNTLRYASRAKFITNKPRINEDPKDAKIREFQAEIERLKAELENLDSDPNASPQSLARQQAILEKLGGAKMSQEKLEELARENQAKVKAAEERAKLIKQTTKEVVTEKNEIMENLKKQQEEHQKMAETQEELRKRLKKMEMRLNMHNETYEKEKKKQMLEYQMAKSALEEQKIKERRLAEDLKRKEAERKNVKQKFTTQKEELEATNKQLQATWRMYQDFKTKMRETEELFWTEREDTMAQIYEYVRELKLMDLIIENFIPEHERIKIEKCAQWDKENETYRLTAPKFKAAFNKSKRPVSALGLKRPVSEYSRVVGTPSQNPRFKYDNILPLDLDMPERTTEDYPQAKESARVKNAFYNILVEGGDDFEYHAVDSQPVLMVPFDTMKPIRLLDTIERPQTANPKTKPSDVNRKKKVPGPPGKSKEAESDMPRHKPRPGGIDPLKVNTYGIKKLPSNPSPDPAKVLYPKNKEGLIDEWVAVERQKQRAIEALQKQEREATLQEKKLYQRLKDIEKRQGILEKQQEGQDILSQHKAYEMAMKQIKEEDKEFKKLIGESYQSQLTEQRLKEETHKKYIKEEEAKIIYQAQKQLEEERRKKSEKKQKTQQEIREEFLAKQEMQHFEKELTALQREEYRRMMLENANREIEREKKYRDYFENIGKKLGEREKLHEKTVITPEKLREQQFLEWVKRNESEYQKRLKEQEEQSKEQKRNNLMSTYEVVKGQIDVKEQNKEAYKRSYPERAIENITLTKAYHEYQEKLRREKEEMQRNYNEILYEQKRLKDDMHSRYGTMTENERRMNMHDLRSFESSQASMSALIPGINGIPSVGSRPTCRGGKAIVNGSFATPLATSKGSLIDIRKQTPRSPGSMSNSPLMRSHYYNPITNPMPHFSQNPYILKEKNTLLQQGSKGFLQTPPDLIH